MSVTDRNVIDGMAKSKEGKDLIFLITDHLDWSDEGTHFTALQDKLNDYFMFIEDKQYESRYPNEAFENYVIEIHFKYDIPEKCLYFLDVVAKQVKEAKINIRIQLAEEHE